MAFKPNAVDEMGSPLCAALAAQEHGEVDELLIYSGLPGN